MLTTSPETIPAELRARVERDERLAGVHPDPHFELERRLGLVHLRDRLLDRERRANRPLRIVLVRDRRPEHGDDGVADELLHRAPVALELVPEPRVVRREERPDVLGVEPLGALGRTDHVREHDRHDLALLAPRGGVAASCAPHSEQNFAVSAFSVPQPGRRAPDDPTSHGPRGGPGKT